MTFLKIILLLPLIIATIVLSAPKTYAASGIFRECNNPAIATSAACTGVGQGAGTNNDPVISILKTAINILSYLIGIAAVITIVISGFRIVMSEGKSENLSSARSAIIFAVVGIIIAIVAQLIVAFVLDKIR